jgi:glutaredoxin-related protein
MRKLEWTCPEERRENVLWSEVERKMLYFSETAWALPDMAEVNDAFGSKYDHVEYEQKIANLIRKLCARARADSQDEFDKWREAVRALGHEDHYLLVIIDAAETAGRPRGDVLKLVAVAMAIVTVFVAIVLLATR